MNSVTFTCEVVTPMFLAGANGQTAELRPYSIKGAMRFWWRAMHGHLPIDDKKDDDGNIIEKGLRTQEAEIYGGGGDKAQRSKINITVSHSHFQGKPKELPNVSVSMPSPVANNENRTIDTDLLKYLSYGVTNREYYEIKYNFEVKFTYCDAQISLDEHILKPFFLMSLFGGLGAKSRNGFGSFKITECSDKNVKIFDNPKEFLQDLSSGRSFGPPCSFTAFSNKTKLFKTAKAEKSWLKSFEVLGKAYAVEKRKLEYAHNFYKRAYIATPIMQSRQKSWHKERHAKQYFLSVTKNEDKYNGWLLFLPYQHRHNTNRDEYGIATSKLNDAIKKHLLPVVFNDEN